MLAFISYLNYITILSFAFVPFYADAVPATSKAIKTKAIVAPPSELTAPFTVKPGGWVKMGATLEQSVSFSVQAFWKPPISVWMPSSASKIIFVDKMSGNFNRTLQITFGDLNQNITVNSKIKGKWGPEYKMPFTLNDVLWAPNSQTGERLLKFSILTNFVEDYSFFFLDSAGDAQSAQYPHHDENFRDMQSKYIWFDANSWSGRFSTDLYCGWNLF
ncbi:hypothetical protein H072_6928 [Dactylellina haptotyla CBS 200.50]|uniref:Uncharacterized protein n=1 Tax=Dactylellina haptotyla (strain CBS 200.50) TaxID=1284197 RepID=S8BIY5_DACHA|nr:hypothetical protein H072_6928 [Dactylellina haptotyla CBS 200.50]